jgi:hypothetical protein
MKKVLFTVLAVVGLGMTFVPALAQDDAEKKFEFNGMIRARYEYLNNYLDLTDNDASGDANDDSFAFAPYRVMVGMTGMFAENVSGHVDLQYIGNFGDQLTPVWGYNFPPDQVFDAYNNWGGNGVNLYSGWIEVAKIGGSDFGARLGRQHHTYGTELFIGDNNYYDGLTLDGIRGMWQHGHSDLNVFYYKLAELNGDFWASVPGDGGGAMDSDLFGATYDWNFEKWGTAGGYVLVGQDMAGYGPVGGGYNFPFPTDNSITTIGARWNRGMMSGENLNMFDWNVEVAIQDGDAGEPAFPNPAIKLSGMIVEGWFGFNFNAGETHGRAHVGFFMSSGDDTATLDEDEGFIGYYGDFHANNRLGDLDLIDGLANSSVVGTRFGVTDINVGYEHWFGEKHYVMLAYHMFNATEVASGLPDDIGDEIDLTYRHTATKNLAFEVTLGQFSPGDAAESFYGVLPGEGDAVERATLQAILQW